MLQYQLAIIKLKNVLFYMYNYNSINNPDLFTIIILQSSSI